MRKLLDIANTSNVPELAESADDMVRRIASGGLSGETYNITDDVYTLERLAPLEAEENGEIASYHISGTINTTIEVSHETRRADFHGPAETEESEMHLELEINDDSFISLYALDDGLFEWSVYGAASHSGESMEFDGIDGKNDSNPMTALKSCLTRLSSYVDNHSDSMEIEPEEATPDIDYDPETGMASDGRHSKFVGFDKRL